MMNNLEDMLPKGANSIEIVRGDQSWGFSNVNEWTARERAAYVSQLEGASQLYALFSPMFPSPQRTWIQVDRPQEYSNILFYHGCPLPALKEYLPMSDGAALMTDKWMFQNVEGYFDGLGKSLGKKVVPYVYCPAIRGSPGKSSLRSLLLDPSLERVLATTLQSAARDGIIDENHIVTAPYRTQ